MHVRVDVDEAAFEGKVSEINGAQFGLHLMEHISCIKHVSDCPSCVLTIFLIHSLVVT